MSKDYLTEDTMLPQDQNFVCISFIVDQTKKSTLTGTKIRGVFKDLDSASQHAKKIQQIDPAHNVFVGEMGKWLAFDPDTTSKAAGNAEYANDQLNEIMKGHEDNQEKTKIFYDKRKYESLKENVEEAIVTSTKTVEDLEKQMAETDNKTDIENLSSKLESINKQIKELSVKKKEYEKKEQSCTKQLESHSIKQSLTNQPSVSI
jgi:chromosome segregation ATPase